MYLRHLIISGLIVGAAMFLPINVFAEENELSGPQNSQKAPGQVSPSVGIDNAVVKSDVPVKQEALMAPNPSMKNGEVKQQRSNVPPNNPDSKKSAAASQNMHNQAISHVQLDLNKNEKSINKARQPEKVAAVQEHNNGLGKHTQTPKNGSKNSDLDSLHNSETDAKKQIQSGGGLEPQGKYTNISVAKSENQSNPFLQEPQEKSGIPSDEERIPKVSQVPNPTQRTSSNGGPSNDRGSQGLSTISFLDKWFVWNPFYEIKRVQSYPSQHTWLNNQWLNAPPSPPPIAAPFHLTFTANLATDNDK